MEELEDLAARVAASMERAEAELADAQKEVARRQDRVKRLKGAMQSLAPKERRVRRSQPARPVKDRWVPRPATQEVVLAAARERPDGVTVGDVTVTTGFSKTTVDRTVRYLKEQGKLRLAGQRGKANLFRTMERH